MNANPLTADDYRRALDGDAKAKKQFRSAGYHQAQDDEWIQPVMQGYRMACCDCGLVHELDFRVRKGRVQFRARRNNRATAARRREQAKRPTNLENEDGERGETEGP